MGENKTFTADDKLACAERELKMRIRVYPRWILDGKMTPSKAGHEIEVMKAIAADYRAQVEQSPKSFV